MTGQAESAPETGGLDDLASFLSESPETDSIDEENEAETVDESNGEADTEEAANDEQDIDPDAPDEGEDADEPAPVAKITFKVKGEDGVEETVEASTDEQIGRAHV